MSFIGDQKQARHYSEYFSGDGVTVAFQMEFPGMNLNRLTTVDVRISGISQPTSVYTISNTTITFASAPPSGTNNIEVVHLVFPNVRPTNLINIDGLLSLNVSTVRANVANIGGASIASLVYNNIIPTTDYASFTAAVAAAAPYGNTILVCSNSAITSNTTVPANVGLWFVNNGQVHIPTGMLVTINGSLEARPVQIFNGDGTVYLGTYAHIPETLPQWWGAQGDGSTDDTAAIQKAILARKSPSANSGGGCVKLLPGNYVCNSTIHINYDGTSLHGSGQRNTFLTFNPNTHYTACIDVRSYQSIANSVANTSQQQIFNVTVRDLYINSTDTANVKIGIHAFNLGTCFFDNITIRSSATPSGDDAARFGDSTHSSIGLLLQGRDFCGFRNMQISADKPIVFEQNPTATRSQIEDADHFNFHDMYLQPYTQDASNTGNPSITFLNGVNVADLSFTGQQAYVGGTYGVYWYDTSATASSYALLWENVRVEQTNDANSYMFHIHHNAGINGLRFRNIYGGVQQGNGAYQGGWYLHNTNNVSIDDSVYVGSTNAKAIHVDSTVDSITCRNSFWQSSCYVEANSHDMIFKTPMSPKTSDRMLGPSFHWEPKSLTPKTNMFGANTSLNGEGFTFAANGSISSVTITDGGTGYSNGYITVTGGGTFNIAANLYYTVNSVSGAINHVMINSAGARYTTAPTLMPLGANSAPATITADGITVGANAIVGYTGASGFLFVTTGLNQHAIFTIQGSMGNTALISDPTGIYGITQGTTNTFACFYDSGNTRYLLQNNTHNRANARWLLIGSTVALSNTAF